MAITKAGYADTKPSGRVVQAIADAEDLSPTDLPPLYDVVDPDALDTVVSSVASDSELVFQYHSYVVTITTSGRGGASVRVSET